MPDATLKDILFSYYFPRLVSKSISSDSAYVHTPVCQNPARNGSSSPAPGAHILHMNGRCSYQHRQGAQFWLTWLVPRLTAANGMEKASNERFNEESFVYRGFPEWGSPPKTFQTPPAYTDM